MSNLRETYDEVSRLLETPEPYSVVEAVEEVRQFWRPKRVATLLLAESHVFTSQDEAIVRLRPDKLPFPGVPHSFVRFVYCLGYGENQILESRVDQNSGTWQYWRIFDSCCNDPTGATSRRLIKRYTRDVGERISAKVALLKQMSERGVWLVDASITGIYHPRGERPKPAVVAKVIERCWDGYIHQVIAEAAPRQIITIGKNVVDILGKQLRGLGCSVEPLLQPQARLSSAEIAANHQRYFRLCSAASN